MAALRGRAVLPPGGATVLRLGGVGLVVAAFAQRPPHTHGWFHTLCGLGMLLLLASSVLGPRGTRWERALAARPLTWLGLVSYSLYLWHEPILVKLSEWGWAFGDPRAFAWNAVVLLAISLPFAWLSHLIIEQPTSNLRALFTDRGKVKASATDLPDLRREAGQGVA